MSTNASAPLSDSRVSFALLAAGRGRRYGPGKLTADLCGRPVWRWAVDSACEAGFADIRVVTNDPHIAADCARRGWEMVANPDAETGIASSLRLAAWGASPDGTAIIALADMPFIEPAHLRHLATTGTTAFTRYPEGHAGVPAAFTAEDRQRLFALTGDRGAASLEWPDAKFVAPPSAASLLDIDTPATLVRAREIAIRRSQAACR